MARNDSPFDMQIKLLMIGDSGESTYSTSLLLSAVAFLWLANVLFVFICRKLKLDVFLHLDSKQRHHPPPPVLSQSAPTAFEFVSMV